MSICFYTTDDHHNCVVSGVNNDIESQTSTNRPLQCSHFRSKHNEGFNIVEIDDGNLDEFIFDSFREGNTGGKLFRNYQISLYIVLLLSQTSYNKLNEASLYLEVDSKIIFTSQEGFTLLHLMMPSIIFVRKPHCTGHLRRVQKLTTVKCLKCF